MSKPKQQWWALKVNGNLIAALKFDSKYQPTPDDFDDLCYAEGGQVKVVKVSVKQVK
jgi:hypothetical protein